MGEKKARIRYEELPGVLLVHSGEDLAGILRYRDEGDRLVVTRIDVFLKYRRQKLARKLILNLYGRAMRKGLEFKLQEISEPIKKAVHSIEKRKHYDLPEKLKHNLGVKSLRPSQNVMHISGRPVWGTTHHSSAQIKKTKRPLHR